MALAGSLSQRWRLLTAMIALPIDIPWSKVYAYTRGGKSTSCGAFRFEGDTDYSYLLRKFTHMDAGGVILAV